MNFDEAIAAHEDWKFEIKKYLRRDIAFLDPEFIEKDDQCLFGRWLNGEGAIYNRWKQYKDLKIENAEFHKCAAEIVRLINEGNIEKAKEQISFNSKYMKHSMSLIKKTKELQDFVTHLKAFQSVFESLNSASIHDVLHIFSLSNIENTIQIIQSQKDDEIFLSKLIYYCYIFRLEESIMNLINHPNFPNEILIKIIFFNFGSWIIAGNDVDEYFANAIIFISPMKIMDILINTDITTLDLTLTLYFLSNLDLNAMDAYFSKVQNIEDTICMFVDIFNKIGTRGMRTFFSRNPHLYGHIINIMNSYKDNFSINEFLTKNERNIELINKLMELTNGIKNQFNYENEKQLPPSKRNQNRMLMVIEQIKDFDNLIEVVNVLHSQGIFIDDSERDIIYNIISDPYLKEHILNHLSKKIINIKNENVLEEVFV